MSDIGFNFTASAYTFFSLMLLPGVALAVLALVYALVGLRLKAPIFAPGKLAGLSLILIWVDAIGLYLLWNVQPFQNWYPPQNEALLVPAIIFRLTVEIAISVAVFTLLRRSVFRPRPKP
ncbi:hypothetical protein [Thalassospira marina]|uniref:Uncharacterized protein n=1 Tax=Thalassospira marina TaxID=2048283 RepID=A0A2N3KZI6_9PROT|nr:hypothetical protein [Thalassospira marina]PKR55948.1 hypothetical protein COO20_01640 [Thalassospira marina]